MSEEQPKGKPPKYHAFQVNEGKDGKGYFNRIGAAFEHKDGKGLSVNLDSVPVDGRVTLRTPKERLANAKEGNTQNHGDQGRDR